MQPDVETVARKLATLVRPVLLEEVRKVALRQAQDKRVQPDPMDIALMAACRQVAAAYDALVQAQHAGAPEYQARKRLEKAAKTLRAAMQRHGRFTGLEQ